MNKSHLNVALLALAVTAAPALAAGPKPAYSTPNLSCTGSTGNTITVQICAGATGAPSGATLQWLTATDFAVSGWSGSTTAPVCDASFSGNASDSRYALAPFQCVSVVVGSFLVDNGFSTSCPQGLECDTQYVFRGFAHGDNTLNRSAFTGTLTCSTRPCEPTGCTFTQGYWKNHPNAWPVDSLEIGGVTYTKTQLIAIFNTPPAGNQLLALEHQLIAALLNIAGGADGSVVASAIADAQALIVANDGTSSQISTLTATLDSFNQGLTGPGHCS